MMDKIRDFRKGRNLLADHGELVEHYEEVRQALERLVFAAACRENAAGDPCHYLNCVAELRATTAKAREILAESKEGIKA